MPQKYVLDTAVPNALEALANFQQQNEPETPELAGLKQIVLEAYDTIEKMRNGGYTWEQISEALQSAQIEIAPTTLESYTREVWPQVRKARNLARRQAKAQANETADDSASDAPISCAKSAKPNVVEGEVV